MTFEPQDMEAVRAYWASYQKLEEEGLVVGTALEDNREALALGQAWARCEAALPEGLLLGLDVRRWDEGKYWASSGDDIETDFHPTPTAALEALAEKLESLRP